MLTERNDDEEETQCAVDYWWPHRVFHCGCRSQFSSISSSSASFSTINTPVFFSLKHRHRNTICFITFPQNGEQGKYCYRSKKIAQDNWLLRFLQCINSISMVWLVGSGTWKIEQFLIRYDYDSAEKFGARMYGHCIFHRVLIYLFLGVCVHVHQHCVFLYLVALALAFGIYTTDDFVFYLFIICLHSFFFVYILFFFGLTCNATA